MKYYYVTLMIDAPSVTIWDILTDASRYGLWNSAVESVEGEIRLGETVKITLAVNPGRPNSVKVTEFIPGRKMTWTGGMALGMFKGVRSFVLLPQKDGSTKFTMREEFKGPLVPIIWRTMPDLGPSFREFATALKRCAESAV